MVNRIQDILRFKRLSPSQLADELGVPRSTISHILSERNKPSLEFIQKVLDRYTDIASEWLVMGIGSMQKTTNPGPSASSSQTTTDLFTQREASSRDPESLPVQKTIEVSTDTVKEKYENLSKVKQPEKPLLNTEKEDITLLNAANQTRRKILKIITYYDDFTFEEFFPG